MLLTKIQTHCKKQDAKMLQNAKVMLISISAAILDRRHLVSGKNLLFYEIFPTRKSSNLKIRTQKCSKLTEFWSKNQFFAIFFEKMALKKFKMASDLKFLFNNKWNGKFYFGKICFCSVVGVRVY
jgi:hypothetical protein